MKTILLHPSMFLERVPVDLNLRNVVQSGPLLSLMQLNQMKQKSEAKPHLQPKKHQTCSIIQTGIFHSFHLVQQLFNKFKNCCSFRKNILWNRSWNIQFITKFLIFCLFRPFYSLVWKLSFLKILYFSLTVEKNVFIEANHQIDF